MENDYTSFLISFCEFSVLFYFLFNSFFFLSLGYFAWLESSSIGIENRAQSNERAPSLASSPETSCACIARKHSNILSQKSREESELLIIIIIFIFFFFPPVPFIAKTLNI